jgi:LynF/TruF/PatF family peptide O-prenyltransferase
MVTTLQSALLSERRLRFVKAHQEAFDVQPWYPLGLFEHFVAQIDAEVAIEASCKIEGDRMQAARFLVFFHQELEHSLLQALKFFHQVERRVEVQLNYELLNQFLGKDFDFGRVATISTGIDLRQTLADSSLKLHFGLNDYREKVEVALALDDKQDTAILRRLGLQFVSLIGFDFYFDGHSEIELYVILTKEQLQQTETQARLRQVFPSVVLEPLTGSDQFYVGLSKASAQPVLYYCLRDKNDLPSYFRLNDMAQRVHRFYQQQFTLPFVGVGMAQSELQKPRIENVRLYYHQAFYEKAPD